MTKSIAIYGAGGLGREVLTLLNALPEWKVAGFYDDHLAKDSLVNGHEVLGGFNEIVNQRSELNLVIAMGDPQTKMKLAFRLHDLTHLNFPVLVHPSAILQDKRSIALGEGSIITAGVIITTNISIGNHVLINLNTTIGHDVKIGSCTSVMPGVNIAGEVEIGSGVLIGSGANVLNRIKVSDSSRVGAGAVVTHNVREGTTVVGVPAKEVVKF